MSTQKSTDNSREAMCKLLSMSESKHSTVCLCINQRQAQLGPLNLGLTSSGRPAPLGQHCTHFCICHSQTCLYDLVPHCQGKL